MQGKPGGGFTLNLLGDGCLGAGEGCPGRGVLCLHSPSSTEGSVLWVGEIHFDHGCVMGNPNLSLHIGSSARAVMSREGV